MNFLKSTAMIIGLPLAVVATCSPMLDSSAISQLRQDCVNSGGSGGLVTLICHNMAPALLDHTKNECSSIGFFLPGVSSLCAKIILNSIAEEKILKQQYEAEAEKKFDKFGNRIPEPSESKPPQPESSFETVKKYEMLDEVSGNPSDIKSASWLNNNN